MPDSGRSNGETSRVVEFISGINPVRIGIGGLYLGSHISTPMSPTERDDCGMGLPVSDGNWAAPNVAETTDIGDPGERGGNGSST